MIKQLLGEFKCNSLILEEYLEKAKSLLEHFADVIISYVSRTSNKVANNLAYHASGYKFMIPDVNTIENGNMLVIDHQPGTSADWRQELTQYLVTHWLRWITG